MRRLLFLLICTAFCMASQVSAQRHALVVHLPSSAVETVNQQALAINDLAHYLGERLPELGLESKIFRRAADASSYVSEPGDHSLILCDAAFLGDLAGGEAYQPLAGFQSAGKGTYRRLVVARRDAGFERLSDLRGRRLSTVEVTSGDPNDYLQQRIFAGLLDPSEWFADLRLVSDDFSATAEVLYGQSDAALVAEFNPLLKQHLEGDLIVLYESAALPLPILAMRRESFSDDERQHLRATLASMNEDPAGLEVLSKFGWDSLSPLNREQLGNLQRGTRQESKKLRILAPETTPETVELPTAPIEGMVPFLLQIELPDLELEPTELAPPQSQTPDP